MVSVYGWLVVLALAGCGRIGFDGDPGCEAANVMLCEDFETGTIDTATWVLSEALGAVTIDNQHVHRGGLAMHAHLDAITFTTNASAELVEDATFPGGARYIRAFAYVATPTSTNIPLYIQVRGPDSGVQLIVDSAAQVRLYEWGATPADQSATSSTVTPTDRWFCLEWMLDDTSRESRTWLDGAELTDLHFVGIQTTPLQTVSIGAFHFQATDEPATDVWLDDIMIDALPIRCSR
jgi:hypothetical protein